jgi:exopolysaccharide production protein ExoZ
MTSPRARSTGNFATIQAGRGLAALSVVLYHLGGWVAQSKYWGYDPLGGVFAFGQAGVEYFFVLSGFIMLHVHRRDFGQSSMVPRFLWKRFCRIYPPYWFILALLVPVYFVEPSFGKANGTQMSS